MKKKRDTGLDGSVNQTIETKEATLMLHTNERIIKHKVGLLNLAEELDNVSRACKVRCPFLLAGR